jgi:hypothetical protein
MADEKKDSLLETVPREPVAEPVKAPKEGAK